MKRLQNKIAVVTGGNSGIGYATAKELIAQGAKVVITGKNQKAVDEAVKTLGTSASGILANQLSLPDLSNLVEKVKSQYGKVDTLFINAGIWRMSPIEAASEEHFNEIMDVNFKGVFFALQKFIPLLQNNSSVIIMSAISATMAVPNMSVYSATQAAKNSLMRVASVELAPKGIRVNSVSPGPINTPVWGKTGLPQGAVDQFKDTTVQKIPLKRLGQPEDIAKLVCFLASDDASFITGSDYVIDGGLSKAQFMR